MRKLFMLLSIVMLLFMVAIPAQKAQAYDLSKALGIGSENTVVLDVDAGIGPTMDVDYNLNSNIDTFTVKHNQHEWFADVEIGVKVLDIVRPFFKYETTTGVYADRRYGVDILIPVSGIDIGLRVMQISRDNYRVSENKTQVAQIRLRF